MNKDFYNWLEEQKYRLVRNNTGTYWAVRKNAIWGWYEITNNDYR